MSAPVADPLAGPEYDLKKPLPDRLKLRIATLKENRERFIAEAQRNLSAMDAAIGELEALLDPESARKNLAAQQNGTRDVESVAAAAPAPAVG